MSVNAAAMDAQLGDRDRTEKTARHQIAEWLANRFPGTPAEVIPRAIRAESEEFADSPVLVERSVRSERAGMLGPHWSGQGRVIARRNPSGDRLDLHNLAVHQGVAALRRCGRAHLTSGRACLLAARHGGGCDLCFPAELAALPDADALAATSIPVTDARDAGRSLDRTRARRLRRPAGRSPPTAGVVDSAQLTPAR
jgi:hypothetical protein